MGRMLVAALVGAIVVFAWGYVSNMVLPWHWWSMKPSPNAAAVTEVLKASYPESGLYLLPPPARFEGRDATDAEKKAMRDAYEAGPIAQVFYRKEGAEMMSPLVLGKGLVLAFAGALIAAVMLNMGARAGSSYVSRVAIVVLMAFFAAVTTHCLEWNYWLRQDAYTLVKCADVVVGWTAAACVMAGILTPKTV